MSKRARSEPSDDAESDGGSSEASPDTLEPGLLEIGHAVMLRRKCSTDALRPSVTRLILYLIDEDPHIPDDVYDLMQRMLRHERVPLWACTDCQRPQFCSPIDLPTNVDGGEERPFCKKCVKTCVCGDQYSPLFLSDAHDECQASSEDGKGEEAA